MKYTLKVLRAMNDLSQREIANEVEVTRQTYNRWEKMPYTIPSGKLLKLARMFKVSVDEIRML